MKNGEIWLGYIYRRGSIVFDEMSECFSVDSFVCSQHCDASFT